MMTILGWPTKSSSIALVLPGLLISFSSSAFFNASFMMLCMFNPLKP